MNDSTMPPPPENSGNEAAPFNSPTPSNGFQSPQFSPAAGGFQMPYQQNPLPDAWAVQQEKATGFFAKLLDFSFTEYVTPSIIRVIYVVQIVLITLGWFFGAIAVGSAMGSIADSSSGGFIYGLLGFVFGVVFGAIPAFASLLFTRVILEAGVALIRVAQNTDPNH